MTDDLTRLKALEAALRSTTQEMATTCSVPMELWDRHSNAVLEAAGALAALSSARAEIEGLKAERDEWKKCVQLTENDMLRAPRTRDTTLVQLLLHIEHRRADRAAGLSPTNETLDAAERLLRVFVGSPEMQEGTR